MGGIEFSRCTPEAAGIPSAAIREYIDSLKRQRIALHSLLVMRHGKLVYEGYGYPYTSETNHRMYSISKSLTSLAIGILVSEGKISLEDHIVDYFKDKCPENIPPYLAHATIRHLLMMSSCHSTTTYKIVKDDDYARTFFTYPPDHEPGQVFIYDTSASQVLGALVERLSGMELLDFLRSRFLDEIGFSKGACAIKDPSGVTLGGSGVMCTPMDLLRIMVAITDPGFRYRDYVKEATAFQISNDVAMKDTLSALRHGYGYYFWLGERNSFYMYGMGGQVAIHLPEDDMIVITTGWANEIAGHMEPFIDGIMRIAESAVDGPLPDVGEELSTELDATPYLRSEPIPEERILGTFRFGSGSTNIEEIELLDSTLRIRAKGLDGVFDYQLNSATYGAYPFVDGWQCCVSSFYEGGILCFYIQLYGIENGTILLQIAQKGDLLTVLSKVVVERSEVLLSGAATGKRV